MNAIILKGPGGVENLVKAEIPIPEISDNDVLIKISAIGLNPIDIKTRKGRGLYQALKESDPIILGWDISGTVAGAGSKVTRFKVGDEAFGMVNFPGHGKAYAEYVAAPEAHLALKPSGIPHSEAAAASLAALTAWQVLKYKAAIKKGDRVLIHAAAGGVGHFAVQMAKHQGAWVAATASARNREFISIIGADLFIDYEKRNFENELHDLDLVLDMIGGDYTTRSFRVLKPGGTIVCIPSGTSEDISEQAAARGLYGTHFRVRSDGGDMKEISDLLERGVIKPCISGTFTFDEIRPAHLQIETGKTRGKLVITVD
jgi:NADPH:quinone reductase-like Zn-dependent oxidoreductase